MKKGTFVVVVYMLFVALGYAQDFQGKAVYQSKTSMADFDFGGRQMSEEQKKRILARIKSNLEKTFVLTFDKSTASYLEEEKLEAPSANGGGGRGRFGGFNTSGKLYKDLQTKTYTNQKEMVGKFFLIQDDLETFKWTMGSETKQIGNYLCYKATTTKTVSASDATAFRGPPRRNEDEDENEEKEEEPTEVEVTAWFTPEIPISQGPGEYWGLPGLILEVSAGKTIVLCTKLVLNATDKEEIKFPTKGKKVTQAEYDETLTKKMEELRERFRGGNRGNDRGPR
ncbi:GLPGLI family protein [Cellulophaga baltica]|uniref:GLPGLI family protein n=1 Tax=Cellulophaga TaxID=104264 RepID=UPI001C071A07|nr:MULTISPECIES: GLPGLI family protein [Cellulophaga]MBU2995134.1 GLPGLI family protein [Cellulophaga baltica]MDO6766529.1 GLPGLI family protein [Cellulophaga sp. 1_MG-2023]